MILDEAKLRSCINRYCYDMKMQAFKLACDAGAKVVAGAYRAELLNHAVKPGGTSFLHAFEAVGSKVSMTKTGDGAYAVIGTKRQGGKRLAPQVLWGERGTVKRQTKSKANRGIMPVQHWLEKTKAVSLPMAQEAMLKALARYVSKH